MSAPSASLHHGEAELFRTLGHPVRIRVLELLEERPMAVRELLADIDVESSSLSQQLAVLRRVGLVTSTRRGGTVEYALATPRVAELLEVGRSLLQVLEPGTAT